MVTSRSNTFYRMISFVSCHIIFRLGWDKPNYIICQHCLFVFGVVSTHKTSFARSMLVDDVMLALVEEAQIHGHRTVKIFQRRLLI